MLIDYDMAAKKRGGVNGYLLTEPPVGCILRFQRTKVMVTPIQTLKQWQEKRPDLFVKLVYNLPGLDRKRVLTDYAF